MGRPGGWVKVHHDLHTDLCVRELSIDARWLFVWGMGHDSGASMTGLSVVTFADLRTVLGNHREVASEERTLAALDELGKKPLALYDFDFSVLWIVNRLTYARSASPNWLKGASNHVARFPRESPVMIEFWKKYPNELYEHDPR